MVGTRSSEDPVGNLVGLTGRHVLGEKVVRCTAQL